MLWIYRDFAGNLFRYLSARGDYPRSVTLRTPRGRQHVLLASHHDLLTVNEIFCRRDYPADSDTRVVVDVGSNVGISALYFLTRNEECRCWLFEPDERNVARLRNTLQGFEDRYTLRSCAVAEAAGRVSFGIEPTGRYGGIDVRGTDQIEVQCLDINDVLEEVLTEHAFIDVLKIDTEGAEIRTVLAIRAELLGRVRRIYIEAEPGRPLLAESFEQRQYGSVCHLLAKRGSTAG